jgi:hypothetical protein
VKGNLDNHFPDFHNVNSPGVFIVRSTDSTPNIQKKLGVGRKPLVKGKLTLLNREEY